MSSVVRGRTSNSAAASVVATVSATVAAAATSSSPSAFCSAQPHYESSPSAMLVSSFHQHPVISVCAPSAGTMMKTFSQRRGEDGSSLYMSRQQQQRRGCASAPSAVTPPINKNHNTTKGKTKKKKEKLTVHDPSNALVGALFTVQRKLGLFRVGDTVVDVGCLPGTSSRCFRQWIDGPSAAVGVGETTGKGENKEEKIVDNGTSTEASAKDGDGEGKKKTADIEAIINGTSTDAASSSPPSMQHWREVLLKRQAEKREKKRQQRLLKSAATDNSSSTNGSTQQQQKDGTSMAPNPQQQQRRGLIVGIDAFKSNGHDPSSTFYVGDVLINKTVQELGADPFTLERHSKNVLKLGSGVGGMASAASAAMAAASSGDASKMTSIHSASSSSIDHGKADIVFIDLCPLLEKELSDAATQLIASHPITSGNGQRERNGNDEEPTDGNINADAQQQQQLLIQQTLSAYHPACHPQYFTRISLPMLLENKMAATSTQMRRRQRIAYEKEMLMALQQQQSSGDENSRLLGNSSSVGGGGSASHQMLSAASSAAGSSFEVLTPKSMAASPTNNNSNEKEMLAVNVNTTDGDEENTTQYLCLSNQQQRLRAGRSQFFEVQDNTTPFESFLEHVSSMGGAGDDHHDGSSSGGGKKKSKHNTTNKGDNNATRLSPWVERILKQHADNSAESAANRNANAIVVRRGSGEKSQLYVMRDNTSAAAGIESGLSHRINYYDFPQILLPQTSVAASGGGNNGNGSVVNGQHPLQHLFRPTPLTPDALFMTSLESIAAAVRLLKPYLKPFREKDQLERVPKAPQRGSGNGNSKPIINSTNDVYHSNSSAPPIRRASPSAPLYPSGGEEGRYITNQSSGGTSGKILLRLVIPSEAVVMVERGGGEGNGNHQKQQSSGDNDNDNDAEMTATAGNALSSEIVLATETRQQDNTLATTLGAISAAYHAFIDTLSNHFSCVEVIDKRMIETRPNNDHDSNDAPSGNLMMMTSDTQQQPLGAFTTYTQLLVLAHNSDSPIVGSEQTMTHRAVKDNPAFILFDRELIMKHEEERANNNNNVNGNGNGNSSAASSSSSSMMNSIGDRRLRASVLKHDLPSASIVLPSGDGLGNKHTPHQSAAASSSSSSSSYGGGGKKPKFRGVYKYISQTSHEHVNLAPDSQRMKIRHTSWSPHGGFSAKPHHGLNTNTVSSLHGALSSSRNNSNNIGGSSSNKRDTFGTLSSLSSGSGGGSHRPANLQLVGQHVIDASTKTFVSKQSAAGSLPSSSSPSAGALDGDGGTAGRKVLSLAKGTAVSATRIGGGSSSHRSVKGGGKYFAARYPQLLQAPPPADELRLRMEKAAAKEVRLEEAQERFNQFKMESIDNHYTTKIVGETR